MCCHPALSPASQIALTLRAVGGLTTAEIAHAFLVPESTMTRRISRAKQTILDSGTPFGLPPGPERTDRLRAVLHALYLIFNEGYAATSGPSLQRTELAAEAIRLTRMVHRLLPDGDEVVGLLALMLLTDARRPARSGPGGEPIPMAQGPIPGLDLLDKLETDRRIAGDHRLHSARGHLLEMSGDAAAARESYLAAAQRTTSLPQQRYLHARAARLAVDQ